MSAGPRDQSVSFLIPGDLAAPTGGYAYARRVVESSAALGLTLRPLALPGDYPRPDAHARGAARQVLASIADGQTVLIDGLALGVLGDELAPHRSRLDLVALVHHPLFRETGLDRTRQAQLFACERAALRNCNRIITTSERTRQDLCATFTVPPDRVFVAQPGTDRRAFARGSNDGLVRLLCVGSVVPRKGHRLLLEVLSSLPMHAWRLDCVGALDRDPAFSREMQELSRVLGQHDRVRWLGALPQDGLDAAWDRADVFVLCSEHEGYGMAYAEAISAGLPIVGTTAAAVHELIDAGAVLVAPGDRYGVSKAMAQVISDARERTRMAAAARRVAEQLPQWSGTAAVIRQVLLNRLP